MSIHGKKGGIEGLLINLMQYALVAVIFIAIFAIMDGFATGSSYHSLFYAKDNAHMVEAIRAVPNGEMHVGYLWAAPDFIIRFNDSEVSVGKIRPGELKRTDVRTKAHGMSRTATLTQTEFEPLYYEYIATPSAITVRQNFLDNTCRQKTTPIGSLEGVSSGQAYGQKAAAAVRSIVQGLENARLGQVPAGALPLKIHLHTTYAPQPEVAVYYKNLDDRSLSIACLIAQHTSMQGRTSAYSHTSLSPANLPAYNADIIVTIGVPEQNGIDAVTEQIVRALRAYEGK